jgi:hypothetical protein
MSREKDAPAPCITKLAGSVTMTGQVRMTLTFLMPRKHSVDFLDRLQIWLDHEFAVEEESIGPT